MSEKQKKFYLTTPIYYVNARPHIGHAYTTIAADVIARRHRLLGHDTFFLTGTDEHGQKVERSAAAAGLSPQQFADEVSASFRALWDRMGITYNDYIRTTEPRHTKGVQKLFQLLCDRDAIYLSTYTGQYSVGEEMFVEGPPGTIGPDGKPTETVTEENYFFRLSKFQRPLIDLIESGELIIRPEVRLNEVFSFLRGNVQDVLVEYIDKELNKTSRESAVVGEIIYGSDRQAALKKAAAEGKVQFSTEGNPYVPGALKDLSVSRTSFKWGVSVPGNEKHVIYVWVDALINYMTAIGYGSDDAADQEKFKKYWPADLHLVGKEIIRFHCVYWPALLLALNPELVGKKPEEVPSEVHLEWAKKMIPKAVTAHGWLLFEESKMSKSRGNIVRTETILDAFGTLKPKPQDLPGAVLSDEYWKKQQDLFAADVLRYFLLREIPFGQDGSFSFDAVWSRYDSDLGSKYGNLVHRTLNLIHTKCDGKIPELQETYKDWSAGESAFLLGQTAFDPEKLWEISHQIDRNDFGTFLNSVMNLVAWTNEILARYKPWSTESIERFERQLVLYTAAESIRIITALLYPVLPYSTAQVWSQLGLGDIERDAKAGKLNNLKWGGLPSGTKLGPLAPIFPRAPKELIQLMTDMEQQNSSAKPEPSKLVDETTTHTTPAPENSTDPAAAPRTSTLPVENPAGHVGGSAAATPELPKPPANHTQAPASGLFATSAVGTSTPDTPQIAIDDFVKIDLRVAKVLVAERIPKADKLLRLEVDLGYEKRQILAGIAEWYTPEEILGRRIIIVANLAPRKMRGLESHGMLLAASHGENGKPILATFADSDEIELGSRLK
jgi:methionyl-tRNA synthetase